MITLGFFLIGLVALMGAVASVIEDVNRERYFSAATTSILTIAITLIVIGITTYEVPEQPLPAQPAEDILLTK